MVINIEKKLYHHVTPFLFSYLNTIVKDLLPDHVALFGSGDDVQKSVRSKTGRKHYFAFIFRNREHTADSSIK